MLLNEQTGESTIDGTDATLIYTIEALTWIESNLPGRSVMGILEEGRQAHWQAKELIILTWAGMECHRRRNGGGGREINPAAAMKVIEAGGGLHPVAMVVMDALMRSSALGLNPDRDRPEDEDPLRAPTTAGASSSGSPTPAFVPPRPGA